jgi:hypothetical protein
MHGVFFASDSDVVDFKCGIPAAFVLLCPASLCVVCMAYNVQQCAAAGQQLQLARVVWRLCLHILDSLIRDGHFDTPLLGRPVNTGRVCMVALRWQSL